MFYRLILPNIALRTDPSHKSEMVNQLLFGEPFEIIEKINHWIYIKTRHDEYLGWMELEEFYYEEIPSIIPTYIGIEDSILLTYKDKNIKLPYGCYLMEADIQYISGAYATALHLEDALEAILNTFIGSPYLWGGRITSGIDCSGLTQLFARTIGIHLPRDAKDQAQYGRSVSFNEMEKGDLLFYKNAAGIITHVGIAMDQKQLLHASYCVHLDFYDEKGIYNAKTKSHSHTFSHGMRITKP